jgi:hypothetical protein
MADPTLVPHHGANAPGRFAAVGYHAIDIADRLWRRLNRVLEKAVVAWDLRKSKR